MKSYVIKRTKNNEKYYKTYINNLSQEINSMMMVFVTEEHTSLHITFLQCFNSQIIFVSISICRFSLELKIKNYCKHKTNNSKSEM